MTTEVAMALALMLGMALIGYAIGHDSHRPKRGTPSIYAIGDRVRHVISGRVGVVTAKNADGTITVGYDISEAGDCFDAELEIVGAQR